MNIIFCPECFIEGEQKCCSHGWGIGIRCAKCGQAREEKDPPWICTGSAAEHQSAEQEKKA